MFARSVVPIVAIVALQAGLVCRTGSAATLTSSLSVSVVVEVGCQVSPAGSGAESAATKWNSPVSVNCSLPTPYQVTVNGSSAADLTGLRSTTPSVTDLRGFARGDGRDLLHPNGRSIRPADDSEYGLVRPVGLGLQAGLTEAARCETEGADAGTVTVTITY